MTVVFVAMGQRVDIVTFDVIDFTSFSKDIFHLYIFVLGVLCMNYTAGFCPDGPECKFVQ